MVRAILEGRKTMTRRTVKPAKCRDTGCELAPCEIAGEVNGDSHDYRYSLYGTPGDRLWVRETFITGYELDDDEVRVGDERVWYRADGEIDSWLDENGYMSDPKWRPSIFMPRALSRITLEITAVRVERLQDISEMECIAEGCDGTGWDEPTAYAQYAMIWKSINGPGSWDANPWVWVIEFKRVTES
jgi:hypothetical protein